MTGLNFVVTVHTLRCPGHDLVPPAAVLWSLYATSLIMLLATPVLAATLVLIAVERTLGIGIFDPALGGDPGALPAPVLVLLAPGRLHHDPAGHGRDQRDRSPASAARTSSATPFVACASVGHRGALGFLVWGHHMFVAGQSSLRVDGLLGAQLLRRRALAPSRCSTGRPRCTAARSPSRPRCSTPSGFIALFTIGGLTGLFLAALAVDQHVHDTYFIVAHFHFIMVGGMVIGVLRRAALLVAEDDGQAVLADRGAGWPRCSSSPASSSRSCRSSSSATSGCRAATTSIRRSSRCSTCCRRPGRPSSRSGYLLPFVYLFYSLRWGEAGRAESLAGDRAGVADSLAAADSTTSRRRRS